MSFTTARIIRDATLDRVALSTFTLVAAVQLPGDVAKFASKWTGARGRNGALISTVVNGETVYYVTGWTTVGDLADRSTAAHPVVTGVRADSAGKYPSAGQWVARGLPVVNSWETLTSYIGNQTIDAGSNAPDVKPVNVLAPRILAARPTDVQLTIDDLTPELAPVSLVRLVGRHDRPEILTTATVAAVDFGVALTAHLAGTGVPPLAMLAS